MRAGWCDQPIVENYVGRQIPTAMVARNLGRGSSVFRPELDVAPFPNLFLVEPPIYASVVAGVCRLMKWPLGRCGRLVSALGLTLAAWGLFGLVARREGGRVGLAAVAILALFPVTLRYGRAVQPDALMIGMLVAGLDVWERARGRIGPSFGAAAVLACALALKAISAYILIPAIWLCFRDSRETVVRRRRYLLMLLAAALIPTLLWYVHAVALIHGEGSRASADNGAIWLRAASLGAWTRLDTYRHIARFLGYRAFTPLAPILAVLGLIQGRADRLWWIWGGSALAAMLAVASKLHHEYYWLSVAPLVAVGMARWFVGASKPVGVRLRVGVGVVFAGMCLGLSASTWRTPAEWRSLEAVGVAVDEVVPREAWVVAPEAVLYQSDRRGCRLEWTAAAAQRAAGEWGTGTEVSSTAELVEFYRQHGASYFADVRPDPITADRLALHDLVRRRYNVVRDQPGVLVVELTEPGPTDKDLPHGAGQPADTRRSTGDHP